MNTLATMIAILLLGSAAESPPQQFDLICKAAGAETSDGAFRPGAVHLRVDLDRKLWCEEPPAGVSATPCAVLKPVAEIQPGVIWFEKATGEEEARGLMHWRAVNRETGSYHYVDEVPHVGSIAIASQCERASFSGFPTVPTKF
jgi:hypothetical protein